MSLINDALKRAEKKLDNNSPDKHQERTPSIPLHASSKNNKRFIILLAGGTLFLATLILLVTLLSSPTPPPPINSVSIPIPSLVPTFPLTEEVLLEDSEEDTSPQEPTEEPLLSAIDTDLEPTEESLPEKSTKSPDITSEMFENLVGFASKAFVKKTDTDSKKTTADEPPTTDESKINYSLSTAQKTLEMLEAEALFQKHVHSPPNPIQNFIDSLEITGVMFSNSESKVLMNNQVYSINSIINKKLMLELIEIHPHEITLKDGTGTEYRREF